MVLIAQETLVATLRQPMLTAFRQRLTVRAQLEPLGAEEATDYLRHQVLCSGGQPARLFTDEALDRWPGKRTVCPAC